MRDLKNYSVNHYALEFMRQHYLKQHTSLENWHEFWLYHCLELALQGLGRVAPNPLVGAVLVRPKRDCPIEQLPFPDTPEQYWQDHFELLGEGYHTAYGELHAEAAALAAAHQNGHRDFQNAILYCNLEPCCFNGKHKQQPPCATEIIQQKIPAVVFANTDPNPLVAGRGAQALCRAGISVKKGYLARTAAAINQAFFQYMLGSPAKPSRPWVTLKLAQSLDGRIATKSGHSQWISGPKARQMVQALRCRSSAVCVGRGTLEADDPNLLLRPPFLAAQQIRRIVWDSNLQSTAKDLQFYKQGLHSIVIHSTEAPKAKIEWLRQRKISAIAVDTSLHSPEGMSSALEALMREPYKIQNLLIEGGAQLASSLLAAGLVDELYCFVSLRIIGEGLNSLGDIYPQKMQLPLPETLNLQGASISRIAEDWDGPDEVLCHGYLRDLHIP